ncbi:unnamed protein product [Adineta steineri]|uniref:DUF4604 domain-containing protein n=1 Tax=Adineta steineri TaxID=433720 RepID=A0A813T842_9BILA|nr:unnamed protein product [Adineta steineri]CAF3513674.1 unnamed protein product [Adineta steineri]
MGKHRHRGGGGGGGGGRGGGDGGGGGGGGGRGGRGGGGRGGRGGGNAGGGTQKHGKILYNSGEEPAFIRQFKQRTGYQAPITAEEKHRTNINDINDPNDRPRDGDYRKDDEKPQIVQLNSNDLSKEEVELEMTKAKEADEEKKCIDPTGRLLFRKPKEKSDESDVSTIKPDIINMASNKTTKRKAPTTITTTTQNDESDHGISNEKKKTKTQLLSFMDESGFDGDD